MSGFEQERRAQRFAFLALGAAALLGLFQVGLAPAAVLGFALPVGVPLAVVVVGALMGLPAVMRRTPGVGYAAAGVMLAGLALAKVGAPGVVAYVLALVFAGALLGFVELVHVAQRHERAHRVVETEHTPEASLDHVTAQTLSTLASRAGLAMGGVALGILITFGLARVGPAQWREAVEVTGPLGVALATLTLFGGAAYYVLVRGARLRDERPEPASQEVEIDVAQ